MGGTLAAMLLRQFVIDGLGHLSTLIADESAGLAAVVDPRRDVDVYLEAARSADVRITHVVETHLHNDYVSGARELATLTGATHVIGAGADLAYEHRPVRDGESFDVGALRFTALETPGHTPEHVAYAVADTSRAGEPLLLFTGGSLLVGAVGRTDLLGEENALPYARSMFHSIREVILPHEDFVGVYPTHGAGSLCSTGIASTPWSTIGFERRHNPMVQPADVDGFARLLLRDQPAYPRYFARMRPTNKAGPRLLGGGPPEPRPMAVEDARSALGKDALLVDLRSPAAHSIAHVPGSVSIPSGSSFGTWLGWVVEPDRPLVLMLDSPADWDDAARQAMRVGYENLARPRPRWFRQLDRIRGAGRVGRPPHGRPARVAARPRRPGGAPRRRRPPGHRVRGRARPGRPAHCGGPPPGPARGPATRPADRDHLRVRLSGERGRVPAAGRRLQRRQLGRGRAPGVARPWSSRRARAGLHARVHARAGGPRGDRRAPALRVTHRRGTSVRIAPG